MSVKPSCMFIANNCVLGLEPGPTNEFIPGARALLPVAAGSRVQAKSAVAQLVEKAPAAAGLAAATLAIAIVVLQSSIKGLLRSAIYTQLW